MPAPRRTTSRTDILEAALDLVREGEALSLDSVARAAHLTKPGLMYHFATKEALMTGLVEHRIAAYEQQLRERLAPGQERSVEALLGAYVDWTFTAEIDRSDLVIFSDPRLRERLSGLWAERLRPWLSVPDDLPPQRRTRLLAARLLADGSWFADASGLFPLTGEERRDVWALARTLLEEAS